MITQNNYRAKYTSTGRHSGYQIELHHAGLKETKSLSGIDEYAIDAKIQHQVALWESKWQKKKVVLSEQENQISAQEQTRAAQKLIEDVENILSFTLDVDDAIDWSSLKKTGKYKSEKGTLSFVNYRRDGFPNKLILTPFRGEPIAPSEAEFAPNISFFDTLFGQKTKKLQTAEKNYADAMNTHNSALQKYQSDKDAHENEQRLQQEELVEAQNEWKRNEAKFIAEIKEQHAEIDRIQTAYNAGEPSAVIEHAELVLSNSIYPIDFQQNWTVIYNPATKLLGVEYVLPSFSDLPENESVRWVKSRAEFVEKKISNAARNRLFESVQYQFALRTIHEIYEADTALNIDVIVFNGIVSSVNAASGHVQEKCIMSVQAGREQFETINLAGICEHRSFKDCFKALKGVAASKLSALAAVKPIIEFDKTDRRFTDHYEVADGLDISSNLAAMDWEDFEHLVREVFEQEFAQNGGEVKVTQASRDQGVDAIAFDPDPIRGGKIVIQAKRYTNVVGVSAVRDLYGTVMNEGATKGILVTTADYGPDAYDFAQNKPLTLLNGSNLLHLLEKHGHKAKIDIEEARLMRD